MRIILFVLCTLGAVFGNLYGQNWDIPASRPNTRYAYDMYTIPRPALSLRGFDHQNLGAYTNAFSPKVFGVKQLIEKIYDSSADPYRVDLIQQHVDNANRAYFANTESNFEEKNAYLLESKALLTLLSYVIERNKGVGEPLHNKTPIVPIIIPSIRTHADYRNEFINDLRSSRSFILDVDPFVAFKRGKS